MEQEAAINEVMLYTMCQYDTAKNIMTALAATGSTPFIDTRREAINILMLVPFDREAAVVQAINRGLDWKTVLD
jgi:hypothetical protein